MHDKTQQSWRRNGFFYFGLKSGTGRVARAYHEAAETMGEGW